MQLLHFEKKKLIGRIILVQENRFRLVGDSGKGYLLMLSHKTTAAQKDLERWRDAGIQVVAEYEGDPSLASGIAHRVEPLPEI
jgi:hypothetical protein